MAALGVANRCPRPDHALGEAFYRRLRSYTDAQLEAGDFSRREIKAGLAEWRRIAQH
ncbi:MAG: DUF6483 family protein [Roseiflexaceae bacterium]